MKSFVLPTSHFWVDTPISGSERPGKCISHRHACPGLGALCQPQHPVPLRASYCHPEGQLSDLVPCLVWVCDLLSSLTFKNMNLFFFCCNVLKKPNPANGEGGQGPTVVSVSLVCAFPACF